MHAVHAVGVGVAEQRGFPAAEAVVGHRYRDGDIDADHAHFDLVLEAPCSAAVVGEDRGAVAVGVVVDQIQGLVVGLDAHHRQHRAEDLVGVDAHLGGDVVDQRRASQNPSCAAVGLHAAAVDDDLGAVGLAGVDVGGDLVAVGLGDQRAHVGVTGAVAGLDGGGAFGDLGDQVIGDRADRHTGRDGHAAFPAEPKPALIIASAARSRSASGRMTAWFFAPPRACTRLPCAVPVRRRTARSARCPAAVVAPGSVWS